MLSIKKKNVKIILFMTFFAICSSLFLLLIGQYSLFYQHSFQFFADSSTYHQAYAGETENFDGTVIGVSNNYLGPLLILELAQGNMYLVMLLNVYIFTCSIVYISKILNINPLKLVPLLFLSPLTISFLLSVNKEIFLFPFIAFALNGYMRRSVTSVAVALTLALFVRWQMVIFYALIILFQFNIIKSRISFLLLVLFVISAAYLLIQPLIEPVLETVALSFAVYDGGGSGLFEWSLAYQNQGLYFLVFPVKAFHLLFGMGFKIENIINPTQIYNDLFIGGHCAVTFLVFLTLVKKRVFSLRNDLMFASSIFLIIFCVTPIFSPRYLYFVFLLWVLILVGAPSSLSCNKLFPISFKKFIS